MLSSMRFSPCHMEWAGREKPQSNISMAVRAGTAEHGEEQESAAMCTLSDILIFLALVCVCAKTSCPVINRVLLIIECLNEYSKDK